LIRGRETHLQSDCRVAVHRLLEGRDHYH
jgi:hypothetical protein